MNCFDKLIQRLYNPKVVIPYTTAIVIMYILASYVDGSTKYILFLIILPFAYLIVLAIICRLSEGIAILRDRSSWSVSIPSDGIYDTNDEKNHSDAQENNCSQEYQPCDYFNQSTSSNSQGNNAKKGEYYNSLKTQTLSASASSRHVFILLSKICIRAYHLFRKESTATH